MNRDEALNQLRDLKNSCEEFESIEVKAQDVDALKYAIDVIERRDKFEQNTKG